MRQENTMKKLLAAACFLLIVHSLPVWADDAPPLPPPIVAIANVLQLEPAQVEALVSMIQARDAAIRPLAEELQKHGQALDQLLQKPDADAATVGQLVLETRVLGAKIDDIRRQANAQFEQVLTADQLARLQHIRDAASLLDVVPPFRAAGLI
jgi:Spy/CpxP family protein refolding chaperone